MNYLEDARIGERREIGSFLFTAEAIKRFAAQYDPQPFHLDEEAGRQSLFGTLSASGWHTACIYMKLLVADMKQREEAARARGEQIVRGGPSPGFKNLKWHNPVLAGDTVTYFIETLATRPTNSRPGWGILSAVVTANNQRGDAVLSLETSAFMPRRERTG